MAERYLTLKVTVKELQALIETADTCEAIGGELYEEAKAAKKAYKAILKRNNLSFERESNQQTKPKNIR